MTEHVPVMINEVLELICPKDNEIYLDCTFGAGGYTIAMLKSSLCTVYGIDRDLAVKKFANEVKNVFGNRFFFTSSRFSLILQVIKSYDIDNIDGIVFDLGMSSMQINDLERGFSFTSNAPLDMRMGNSDYTAYDFVNGLTELEITKQLYNNSGERYARKIAKAIVNYRNKKMIETTDELVEIVHSVVPKSGKIDSATRSFQSIRIWVNQELEELETALLDAASVLSLGGKLLVVSFHSLEDRIVKKKFDALCGKIPGANRNSPGILSEPNCVSAKFMSMTSGVVKPTKLEINANCRSRSAKLRCIKRISN